MPWEGREGTDNPLKCGFAVIRLLTAGTTGTHHLSSLLTALVPPMSETWFCVILICGLRYIKKKKKSSLSATRASENVSLLKEHSLPPQPHNVLRCYASCPLPEVPFANIFIHGHLDFLHFFVLFLFFCIYLSQLHSFLLVARLKLLKTSCWLSEPHFLIQIHLFAWSFIHLFNKSIRE